MGLTLSSCSSSSSQDETETQVTEEEIVIEEVDSSAVVEETVVQEDTTAWPDEVANDGSFQDAAVETPNTMADVASSTSTKSTTTTSKSTAETTSTTETKKTTTTTTKPSTSSKSSASTKAITSKLTKIYALKTKIGDKLDCMRVNPLSKVDRVKAGQLHDKYVGILPKMLPWVRFSDGAPKILKTEPEKLEKLNSLSSGWMQSYESIDSQANSILEKYKEKEFYAECSGK